MIPPGVDLLRPGALALLACVVALGLLGWLAERARRRALASFAGEGAALVSRRRAVARLRHVLLLTALAAAVFALGGPRIGVVEREVAQRGADLVIALDVSQSMAVADVAPNRLQAARQAVVELVRRLEGSRLALVLFAGDAVARYPATSDVDAILAALDNSARGFRPSAGSSLSGGINAALAALPPSAGAQRRALLVLSDGEDASAELPDAEAIRDRGVRIYAMGIGTPEGGNVPTYDAAGRSTGPLRGADGQPVVSRLQEQGLRVLAERGGGAYWRYSGGDAPPRELASKLRALDVSEVAAEKVPADRFQWFVGAALLLLLVEQLTNPRGTMPAPAVVTHLRDRRRASAAGQP